MSGDNNDALNALLDHKCLSSSEDDDDDKEDDANGNDYRRRKRSRCWTAKGTGSLVGGTLFFRSQLATGDVSACQRRAAWRRLYRRVAGETRCFVCLQNPVGLENNAFHMAHVVPRARGGVNGVSFNRVPTCATCNAKNGSSENLLDYIALNFPDRIVPVVLYLKSVFDAERPWCAPDDLCAFVRRTYGDRAGYTDGYVRQPLVYDALLAYQDAKREIERCNVKRARINDEARLLAQLLARHEQRANRLDERANALKRHVNTVECRWPD